MPSQVRRHVVPEPPAIIESLFFRLAPAQELPTIANTHTIGSLVLGKQRWVAFISRIGRHTKLLIIAYLAGLFYRTYGMLVAPQYSGHWWLVLSPMLLSPSVLSMTLSLRYDFVRQLVQSFDFWFFFAVNVVWVVSLCIGYHDSRAVICLVTFLELENSKMIDANAQRLPMISLALLMNSTTLIVSTIGIAVDAIHLQDVVVWQTPRGYILRLEDVLLNAMATVVLLLVRIAYNRRNAWRKKGDCYVRCVSCRCRLAFSVCSAPGTIAHVRSSSPSIASEECLRGTPMPVVARKPPLVLSVIQLECVTTDDKFSVDQVVGGCTLSQSKPPLWLIRCWTMTSLGAIGAGIALLNTHVVLDVHHHTWLATLAVSLTACAVSPFVALHQTQLLRRLFTSFDFLFLLLQAVSTGVCVCHLMHWRSHQCAVVVCGVLWFCVMITYDALKPSRHFGGRLRVLPS